MLILVCMVGMVRLLFLLVSPLELSPDEAYYWDWSRHLSFGYYSKPPMIAWLMALSTCLFSSSEFGVRFPAVVLNVFTALGIFLTGRKMADSRAGFLASLAYCATVGSAVSGFIMTIDAPLLCFWTWTLYFFSRADASENKGSGRDALVCWVMAGIACGLGLLSKQTMIAMSGACCLFFVLTEGFPRLFRLSGPWLFYGVQLSMLFPFLFWNYRHGWITFVHTAHHFEQAEKTAFLRVDTFFELVGSQAGIVTPVIFIMVLCAAFYVFGFIRSMKKFGNGCGSFLRRSLVFLELTGAVPLLAVFALSLKQRVNANWPAPFYLSLCVLVGIWLTIPPVHGRGMFYSCRRLFRPGLWVGFSMVAALYVLPFVFVYTPLSGSKLDPTLRLRGWKELSMQADSLLSAMPDPQRSFVVARRRQTASELAFYMKGQPVVYRWNGHVRKVKSQYELWPSPLDDNKEGWDGLVLVEADKSLEEIDRCFDSFRFLSQVKVRLGKQRTRVFNVYIGRGLRKWATR